MNMIDAIRELVRLNDQYRPDPAPHEWMKAWDDVRDALSEFDAYTNELPDQKVGQAKSMLICEGPGKIPAECGHWYSPDAVRKLLTKPLEDNPDTHTFTVDLGKLDGTEIAPQIFIVGKPTPVPGTNKMRALANMHGCLCTVELSLTTTFAAKVS